MLYNEDHLLANAADFPYCSGRNQIQSYRNRDRNAPDHSVVEYICDIVPFDKGALSPIFLRHILSCVVTSWPQWPLLFCHQQCVLRHLFRQMNIGRCHRL